MARWTKKTLQKVCACKGFIYLLLKRKEDPSVSLAKYQNNVELGLQIKLMRARLSLCALLTLMLLLHQPVAALNWQGTGNLNNDNLTVIWAYIEANFKAAADADTIQDFNTALSNRLNDLWAPAWNIVTVKITRTTSYNDVLLYGYAFRNRWMWFNGYTDPTISGTMFSFVIWKDYNCHGWKTIGVNANPEDYTSFSGDQTNFIGDLIAATTLSQIQDEPWSLLKSMIDAIQASNLFVNADDHAYSAVLSQQSYTARMYGRACLVDNNFYYSPMSYSNGAFAIDGGSNGYGSLLLFQTR